MKFCINCGRKIKMSHKFCPFCGAKQPEQNRNIPNNQYMNTNYKAHKHSRIKPVIFSIIGVIILVALIFGGIKIYHQHTQVATSRDVTKYLGSNNLFNNVHYNKKDNTASLSLSNQGIRAMNNYYTGSKIPKEKMRQEQKINTKNLNYHDFEYSPTRHLNPQNVINNAKNKITKYNHSFKLRTNLNTALISKYNKLNNHPNKKTWNNTVSNARNIFLKRYNKFNRIIPDRKHNVIEINLKHSLYKKINLKHYCTTHDLAQRHIRHLHIPIYNGHNSTQYVDELAKSSLPSNISRDTYKLAMKSNNLGVRVVVTAKTPQAHITVHHHGGLIGKEYTDNGKFKHNSHNHADKAEYKDVSLNHKAGYLSAGNKHYPKVTQEIYVNSKLYEAKLSNGKYINLQKD